MTNQTSCPFCTPRPDGVFMANQHVLALKDGFPVSPGHTLLVPRRHIASFFELTDVERDAMFQCLVSVKKALDKSLSPNGYNIGINDGSAAGQTVMHMHLHLIPRYLGDQDDPRGGVRWIFPAKADYWTKQK